MKRLQIQFTTSFSSEKTDWTLNDESCELQLRSLKLYLDSLIIFIFWVLTVGDSWCIFSRDWRQHVLSNSNNSFLFSTVCCWCIKLIQSQIEFPFKIHVRDACKFYLSDQSVPNRLLIWCIFGNFEILATSAQISSQQCTFLSQWTKNMFSADCNYLITLPLWLDN